MREKRFIVKKIIVLNVYKCFIHKNNIIIFIISNIFNFLSFFISFFSIILSYFCQFNKVYVFVLMNIFLLFSEYLEFTILKYFVN